MNALMMLGVEYEAEALPAPKRAAIVQNLGHKQDDESGLTYMRARFYEPGSGRFVSEDPSRKGANWYVYCSSDPVNYGDYSGRWILTIGNFTFRLDNDIVDAGSGLTGDLHVFQNGKEVFSKWWNGFPHDMQTGEITRDMVKAIADLAKGGNKNAKDLLNMFREGFFGADTEMVESVCKKVGVKASLAYTSVDAYAEQDPVGFISLMRIIYTGKDD